MIRMPTRLCLHLPALAICLGASAAVASPDSWFRSRGASDRREELAEITEAESFKVYLAPRRNSTAGSVAQSSRRSVQTDCLRK